VEAHTNRHFYTSKYTFQGLGSSRQRIGWHLQLGLNRGRSLNLESAETVSANAGLRRFENQSERG